MSKDRCKTTATHQQCPVAALADEALPFVEAHELLDWTEGGKIDEGQRERFDEMDRTVYGFIRPNIRNRATFLRATSGRGALFQLCLVADLVDDLDGYIPKDGPDAKRTEEAIKRLLYSISDFIESTTGARLEDECAAEFALPRDKNPHFLVDQAIALAAGKRAARRSVEKAA